MKKLVVLFLYLSLFLLSFTSYAGENTSIMAQEILNKINLYRVQHGLAKLEMNSVISHEAQLHSQAMAHHARPFSHQGFAQRIQNLRQHFPKFGAGSENIAFNYKTAQIVVDGWLKSPGHRRNIMGRYQLTGIGIAHDQAGKPYYTQIFLAQK